MTTRVIASAARSAGAARVAPRPGGCGWSCRPLIALECARVSEARINPYWFGPTIAILVPLVLGPLGAWLRILRPDTAFMLVGVGALLALISAVLLPGAAALASVAGRPWRAGALRGAVVPVGLVLAGLVAMQVLDAAPINDVSTDLADRPEFAQDGPAPVHLADVAEQRMEWLAEVQRESYPDLQPLALGVDPETAFALALETARAMPGWAVVRAAPERGRIEATATTRVFGFVDDVVIRVRGRDGGSRVDLRSRSRLGRGRPGDQRRADPRLRAAPPGGGGKERGRPGGRPLRPGAGEAGV